MPYSSASSCSVALSSVIQRRFNMLLLGAFLTAAFGYLLGLPALRLGPLYVSMVTFGFGLIVVIMFILSFFGLR